jgi:hypothetical protein
MLTTRNKSINVYGGPLKLGTRLQNVSRVNINEVTKYNAKRVIFSLLYSIVLLAIIVHILTVTTSDDIGTFKKYIISLSEACRLSLEAAIKLAQTMKDVPQTVINFGTGVMSSVLGNISTLRRPQMKKALTAGVLTGVGMSIIPGRGNALTALTRLRNTVTPSKKMVLLMKVANSTIGRASMTWAGLKTTKDLFNELAAMVTRYLISFSVSYGISVARSIREFKKFRNLPRDLRRAYLLTEPERLQIAGKVLNYVTKQALTKNNNNVTKQALTKNNNNAARTLLSLRAGNTR